MATKTKHTEKHTEAQTTMELLEQKELLTPSDVIQMLYEPLPTKQRVIATTSEGRVYGSYIQHTDILRRLHQVFGLVSIYVDPPQILYSEDDIMSIVVRCTIEATPDTTVQGFGTAVVERTSNLNYFKSQLENAVKKAETDALKRASLKLGIGLFQYDEGTTVQPFDSNDNGTPRKGLSLSPDKERKVRDAITKAFGITSKEPLDVLLQRVIDENSRLESDRPTVRQVAYGVLSGVPIETLINTPRSDNGFWSGVFS